MSQPRRGLGRGLDALLGDAPVPVAASGAALREIAVGAIVPNPFQPRKTFDDATLGELQTSIAQHGVLVPIIVRRRGDRFELIAGERRWRASAALQRPTIPAIVRESDDRTSLEVAIVENLQREDLNPIEEAAGLKALIDEGALTQDDVARRVGKSRSAVANALRLLALPDAIAARLVDGTLSAGHARALLSAPAERRGALAERAVAEGLSVRALERLAHAAGAAGAPAHAPAVRARSPEVRAFEDRLRERFATHVTVVRNGRGGRIELRFSDDADLTRIGDLLLPES